MTDADDPATLERLRAGIPHYTPVMRPAISTRTGLSLIYTDHANTLRAMDLTEIDLAHLQVSIAAAQAVLARRRLAALEPEPPGCEAPPRASERLERAAAHALEVIGDRPDPPRR